MRGMGGGEGVGMDGCVGWMDACVGGIWRNEMIEYLCLLFWLGDVSCDRDGNVLRGVSGEFS